MIDSHKSAGLVDYAHRHFINLNDAPVSIRKKDLILRKGFVDSVLFTKPVKYKNIAFNRKPVTDEFVLQGFKCDLISVGSRRALLYIQDKIEYTEIIKSKLQAIANRMAE
jgi:hypothetical protein